MPSIMEMAFHDCFAVTKSVIVKSVIAAISPLSITPQTMPSILVFPGPLGKAVHKVDFFCY